MTRTQTAHGALILQNTLLGMSYSLGALASTTMDPNIVILLRMIGAAFLYFLVFTFTGGWRLFKPTGREWRGILVISLLGTVFNQALFIWGLKYTSPSSSAILYACTPLMVLLFSTLIQRTEKLRGYKLLSILLSFSGVAIIILLSGNTATKTASNPLLGNILTLLGVTAWAIYISFSRPYMSRFRPEHFSSVNMMLAMVFFLPYGMLMIPELQLSAVPTNGWIGIASLIIFNSLIGYFLMLFGLRTLKASQAAVYINLQPIVSVAISMWYLGDSPQWFFYMGGAMILGGILLLNRYRDRS